MTERIAVIGKEVKVMLGFRGELLKELVTRGHTVYAFATDYTEESKQLIRSLGLIPISYRLNNYGLNPIAELITIFQLWRRIKRLNITLTYCYFAKPVLYGTFAAWLARVPHRVAKIEGLGRPFTRYHKSKKLHFARQVQSLLFKWILPKAHELVLLNKDDWQDLKRICGNRLPNTVLLGGIGVCLEHFQQSPVPTKPLVFSFIGRLLNEKGIRYFLSAAERIKKDYPEVEFWVLGQADPVHGVSRQELNTFVNRNIIRYFGQVDNVADFLHKTSVFVMPSYYREGLPRSSQEALAVGRPIITTDNPGCRETVVNNENGLLVQPRDSDALITAMQHCIDKPEYLQAMGDASRRLAVKHFDVTQVNQRMLKVLGL
ncbi:MAG: glycosyltransferase family 1 protein [Idiomarina sp.]|uniref:glycosyltransferase family 4 protein n=1 Tax=Idiomarina sp. TaxID=1874361 RepID=UPI000C40393A|nr:glycosyltransferase family 4 protein [Idiomarina sp.]MBT42221.1 glycosyltransferase family 1 protein [Idiomarina sp.]